MVFTNPLTSNINNIQLNPFSHKNIEIQNIEVIQVANVSQSAHLPAHLSELEFHHAIDNKESDWRPSIVAK